VVENPGFCLCCRQSTTFREEAHWLRDHYVCLACRSIPRQRHLALVLQAAFPSLREMRVHESSPSSEFVAGLAEDYSFSHLLGGVQLGGYRDGIRCEDLEQSTFDDETFDIFVTQDVLEHVFDPAVVLSDILRVLRPGGAHVFTTPKHRHLANSRRRATRRGEEVVHLLDPEYHGNPIGDGRSLVTWGFGLDFEKIAERWSGVPVATYLNRDRYLGLDAEYLEVFVMRRPEDWSVPVPPPQHA